MDMVSRTPTWAIVATIDEPPALVQAFVALHLMLGAQEIFLYCDRPRDTVQKDLAHLAQVTVIPCDALHWRKFGKKRPHRHQIRQTRNATDAYARTTADWLLHCDADEFLRPSDIVSDVLRTVPDDIECLIVDVAERVHPQGQFGNSIFDGAFRRPLRISANRGTCVFGDDYALTNRGLTGHAQGKAFVRTGCAVNMSIHRPRARKKGQEVLTTRADVDALKLLHFEGLTKRYWAYKLSRMVFALRARNGMPPSEHRRRQAEALISAPDSADDLYQRLKCPDVGTIKKLCKRGLWDDEPFDPSVAVAKYFPARVADPSPNAVDQWLDQHKQHVTSFMQNIT